MVLCAYLRFLVFTIFTVMFLFTGGYVHGQELGLGVATYVPVVDPNVEDGSIIISTAEGFYLSRYPYDNTIAGVVSTKPAVVLGLKLKENDYALNTKGRVKVRVSTNNGQINSGDLLTSSVIPGVAMKATRSGTVIGTALENYTEEDKNKVGTISALLNIYYAQDINDKNENKSSQINSYIRPSLGVIIAIVTVVLSFIFFGRLASSSIEALGRNPSASGRIRFGILVEILLLLMLAGVGSFIAYLLVMP